MRIFEQQITLIEVPGEVSLTLGVSGCPHNCPGCSWAKLDTEGSYMSLEQFKDLLRPLTDSVTVVTFLGGDWCSSLTDYLMAAKELGFKTCLYTGVNNPDRFIKPEYGLDYLKTGEWNEKLGGLESEHTNQRLINITTGENMNHLFRRST